MRKWAADPPRDDYPSATRPRRPEFERYLVPAEDDLGAQATRFGTAVEASNIALEAALRAYEKYLGAKEAQDAEAAAERRSEATEYARAAAAPLSSAADSLDGLNDRVAERPDLGDEVVPRRPRRPSDLPSSTLAVVYLTGVRLNLLTRYLGVPQL